MIPMTLLLVVLVLAALWASMATALLRATLALALTSALLAVFMFSVGAVWAAVIELSVCAGLISVIFVSVISLTEQRPFKELLALRRNHLSRFWPLPLLLIAAGVGLSFVHTPVEIALPLPAGDGDVRTVLWTLRQLDLFGQILILLAGVFGVLVLFKKGAQDGD
jgi:NADH-quinone oxidoreductase subunit J